MKRHTNSITPESANCAPASGALRAEGCLIGRDSLHNVPARSGSRIYSRLSHILVAGVLVLAAMNRSDGAVPTEIDSGKSLILSVTANGTQPFSYQWYFNNQPIAGATQAHFSINSIKEGDAGSYFVIVSNSSGSTTAEAIDVVLKSALDLGNTGSSNGSDESPSENEDGESNGDGVLRGAFSELVLQNLTTGQRQLWLMSGFDKAHNIDLGWVEPSWEIEGTGDFNHDGEGDIIWSNIESGQRALWLMSGVSVAHVIDLGWVDRAWDIVGTGDLNRDDETDILWQNIETGQRALWLMKGLNVLHCLDLGQVDLSWSMAATGDFDGDGGTDILWQNLDTGQRALWVMDGFAAKQIVNLGWVDTSWSIASSGDFDNDLSTDIVWENTATGQRAMWLMERLSLKQIVDLGLVSVDWGIVN